MEIKVSVIICCYNSAARLPQTLRHLAEQQAPPGFAWEIMVINNASTDNTAQTAEQCWADFGPAGTPLRVIDEPVAGQMHARKRGALEARSECLVFCDDDNWLNEVYVALAWEMMQGDPLFGAGGGMNVPVTDAPAYPEWFEEYKDKYAISIRFGPSGDVSQRGLVLGAGLVTRRSLFLAVNDEKYPSLLNGRDGQHLSTGDDFEYCKRLLLWGYKLYYDERMQLQHFIPAQRLTLPYREKLMAGIDEAGRVLDEYDLAIRLHRKNKTKNRWRLLLLAPFRILLCRMGLTDRVLGDERLTLYYLWPQHTESGTTRARIKKFIYRQ
ncbi:glycosyltransferase family 2 protein [Chitinophaga lutea]|uniref:Glycosyltransferase family 2 protein n=1 Tax=Chitinophaga lutea TaxID=2488634 RepID=A0A3N4PD23_9BACT|nr:glycosyltransferase [Chitinophaga lutea]RPE05975.1 glycosyltransferase family 2 protein [Chitinophaga lutea]